MAAILATDNTPPGEPLSSGLDHRPATKADRLSREAQDRIAAKAASVQAARAKAAAHAKTAVICGGSTDV